MKEMLAPKILIILLLITGLTNQQKNITDPNILSTVTVAATSINQLTADDYNLTCPITFVENITTDLLRQYFKTNTSGGLVYMVYFKLKYQNQTGHTLLFDIVGEDTFSPELWVWAAGKGKNLLRLPLDHKILSLGLLTIQSASLDIPFDYATYSCMKQIPFKSMVHIIGKFISENITANGSAINQDTEGPIICRSVYAFDHVLYGRKGIGFDCCAPGKVYICDKGYSDAYELIWYGPIVLMCMIYIIGIVHFYKLYKKTFNQTEVRKLSGLKKTIDEIKHDIVDRIVTNTEKWARIQTPEALIALRERCGLLEVLGVGKTEHSKIVSFFRAVFCIFIFVAYYAIWAVFLRVYWDVLRDDYDNFKDSQTVFLNVVGHIGWIFCPRDLGIFPYAVFEFIYTAIVPFLALFVYMTIRARKNSQSVNEKTSKCYANHLAFCESQCGKALQFISIVLLLLHIVLLSGVFLSYIVYLVGLGIFANIDVVSPWIIPIALCLHFFSTSFDPAYNKYKHIKDSLFTICFEDFKKLIIKQNKEIFLPRDLIEDFYIPNSRNLIYSCLLRIFWVLTCMFLLVLVVLTLQYPYNTKLTSLVPFLGVQVIFVLPYLTKIMYVSNTTSALEDTVLKRDLRDYIKQYIKQRPELRDSLPEQGSTAELLKSSSNDEVFNDNKSSSNLLISQDAEININTDAIIDSTKELAKRHKIV